MSSAIVVAARQLRQPRGVHRIRCASDGSSHPSRGGFHLQRVGDPPPGIVPGVGEDNVDGVVLLELLERTRVDCDLFARALHVAGWQGGVRPVAGGVRGFKTLKTRPSA